MHAISTITDHSQILDADQLAEVASGSDLRIDVMSPKGGMTHARRLQGSSGWSLDVTDFGSHVRASGAVHADAIAILTVKRASGATICRTPMQQDTVLIIPGGVELTASILPGLRYATAVLPMSRWQQIEAAITGRDPRALRSPVAFRVPENTIRYLAGLANELAADPSVGSSGEGMPAPLADHLSAIAEALAHAEGRAQNVSRSQQQRIRQAWAAHDYIQAHFEDSITIETLCREVGASRRQLEYAFRSVFAVAPHEFVERIRLNECHRRLKAERRERGSVTRIAMDAGFSHMSRFASSYRKLFGERPKDTGRLLPGC